MQGRSRAPPSGAVPGWRPWTWGCGHSSSPLNQPALLAAVDRLLDNLQSYRDALASGNRAALAEKLAHSAARKREMDLPGPDLLA